MSTEAKHTPGPWTVNGYGYRRNDAAPTGREVYLCSPESGLAEGYLIAAANATVCEIKTHRRAEDAALIAAAPDLLEACKLAVATVERLAPKHGPFTSADGTLSVLNAAIAKAGAA